MCIHFIIFPVSIKHVSKWSKHFKVLSYLNPMFLVTQLFQVNIGTLMLTKIFYKHSIYKRFQLKHLLILIWKCFSIIHYKMFDKQYL